jgi:SAM-dependent methyltransferase
MNFKTAILRKIRNGFRGLKQYFQRDKGLGSFIFFKFVAFADFVFSAEKKIPLKHTTAWSTQYTGRFGVNPIYICETNRPVALDSIDYICPRGAIRDNSKNLRFNQILEKKIFPNKKFSLLDFGCAGGGFVRSILEAGHVGVGLDGSDIQKKRNLGEWSSCPLHFFTVDLTEKFHLKDKAGAGLVFDIVTAWEVLEHIEEEKIPILIQNAASHLKTNGLFVASIDQTPDFNPITGANYHVTLKSQQWWIDIFNQHGFKEFKNHPFQVEDFVRGNGLGLKNWDPRDGDGFHVVLSKV